MSDDLHAKIDALTEQVARLTGALGLSEPVKALHAAEPERLTAADVHAATFTATRMLPGYHIPEVDAFMDRAAAEIARLTEERDEARRERNALL